MRLAFRGVFFLLGLSAIVAGASPVPRYTLDELVRLAQTQNPEIAIAQKKIQAAHGGKIEARAGYLPSVVSNALYRRRERAETSRLRPDDYSTSVRVVENLYTGGATSSLNAIALLALGKQADEPPIRQRPRDDGGAARLLRAAPEPGENSSARGIGGRVARRIKKRTRNGSAPARSVRSMRAARRSRWPMKNRS